MGTAGCEVPLQNGMYVIFLFFCKKCTENIILYPFCTCISNLKCTLLISLITIKTKLQTPNSTVVWFEVLFFSPGCVKICNLGLDQKEWEAKGKIFVWGATACWEEGESKS